MDLKIKWTDFSKKELKNIFEYYKEKASHNVARNLVTGIARETLKLKKNPTIGQEEELLKNDSREFRYLVYKSYLSDLSSYLTFFQKHSSLFLSLYYYQ